MWSISQREHVLLRFVRMLDTMTLIQPPTLIHSTTKDEEDEKTKGKDEKDKKQKKDDKDEDDAESSAFTSHIRLPDYSGTCALLSAPIVESNKARLRELELDSHLHALWAAMDSYFAVCETRHGTLAGSGKQSSGIGKEKEDEQDEDEDEDENKETEEKRDDAEDATMAHATSTSASSSSSSSSRVLDDHRQSLGESDEDDVNEAAMRESDILLLMHLPLIESYFIFNAPRQQPKVTSSLELPDQRDEFVAFIKGTQSEDSDMPPDEATKAATPSAEAIEPLLTALHPPSSTRSTSAPSPALAAFYSFTSKHRRPLNAALRQHKSLLSGAMRSLLWHPHKILDFDIRRRWFKTELKKLVSKIKHSYGDGIKLHVRRDRIFEDSYHQLSRYTKKEDLLKSKLTIKFYGEEGLDAGGLAREWFLLLSRAIFNADNALFKPAADNPAVFQPNPESHINPDHLDFFTFAGRFVAKALIDNQRLDAYFTRSFYKHLLCVAPSFADVESVDPGKAKSLEWMLRESIDHILFETFSVESSDFGVAKTVDLVPSGRNFQVSDANKRVYVHLISEFILTRAIRTQLQAFLRGFHQLIPPKLISVFNEQEIELMVCGLPDIDLADLKRNTEYVGFGSSASASAAPTSTHPPSQIIEWFWQIVSEFGQEEKALLLLFVTGTSKVPLEGFKALQGTNGITRFTLQKAAGIDTLPVAHTCFNQLDLPDYTSVDVMREKLMLALREGSQGFGFR